MCFSKNVEVLTLINIQKKQSNSGVGIVKIKFGCTSPLCEQKTSGVKKILAVAHGIAYTIHGVAKPFRLQDNVSVMVQYSSHLRGYGLVGVTPTMPCHTCTAISI